MLTMDLVTIVVLIVTVEVLGIVLCVINLIHKLGWKIGLGRLNTGWPPDEKKWYKVSPEQAYNLLILYHLLLLSLAVGLAAGTTYTRTFCITGIFNYTFIIFIIRKFYVNITGKLKGPALFTIWNFFIFWSVAITNIACRLNNCSNLPMVAQFFVVDAIKYSILVVGYCYMFADACINTCNDYTFTRIKSREKAVTLLNRRIQETPKIMVAVWNKKWWKFCSDIKQGSQVI